MHSPFFFFLLATTPLSPLPTQTEHAFSGTYCFDFSPGIYHCAQCNLPLFNAKDQYNAENGWPAFTQPIDKKNIYYLEDWNLPFKRYAVVCRSCHTPLGHLFRDGPPPTYFRYTIKSIALNKQKG